MTTATLKPKMIEEETELIYFEDKLHDDDVDFPPIEKMEHKGGSRRCEWNLVKPCTEEATMFYDVTTTDYFADDIDEATHVSRTCLCPRHFVYRMRSLIEIRMRLWERPGERLIDWVDRYGFLSEPHSAKPLKERLKENPLNLEDHQTIDGVECDAYGFPLGVAAALERGTARRTHSNLPPNWISIIDELDRELSKVDPNYELKSVANVKGQLRYPAHIAGWRTEPSRRDDPEFKQKNAEFCRIIKEYTRRICKLRL